MIDRYRDLDSLSPIHRFDDFPPMLRRAGLEPLELLDSSSHVEKSVKMWWERTEADLENLTNLYGKQELADFIGLFDDVITHGGPEYLIFNARKPIRPRPPQNRP